MTLSITIPGKPVGKQRPRMTKRGHVYTPEKTENYEAVVRSLWIQKHGKRGPMAGAVRLYVDIYIAPPKSASQSMLALMRQGKERPTKKPDVDNVLKTISDALNGIAYEDDKQIVESWVTKWYGDRDEVEIEVMDV